MFLSLSPHAGHSIGSTTRVLETYFRVFLVSGRPGSFSIWAQIWAHRPNTRCFLTFRDEFSDAQWDFTPSTRAVFLHTNSSGAGYEFTFSGPIISSAVTYITDSFGSDETLLDAVLPRRAFSTSVGSSVDFLDLFTLSTVATVCFYTTSSLVSRFYDGSV